MDNMYDKTEELEMAKGIMDKGLIEKPDMDDEDDKPNKPKEPMHEDEIVAFLIEQISKGVGGTSSSNGDLSRVVEADDYYFGRLPKLDNASARDPKASRFVSLDVQDAIEATVAEIMPTFATDELAFYTPDTEEDEEQAKIESNLVNYMFFNECDGYTVLQACLRNCLLKQNSTAKVYWDSRTAVRYERYENVNALAIELIMNGQNNSDERIEIVEQEAQEQEDNEEEFPQELFTVTVRIYTLIEKPVIESVKPSRVIVSSDHDSPHLHDVLFVAHINIVTQSDLIAAGFPKNKVEMLTEYHSDITDKSNSSTQTEFDYTKSDESTRYIETHECYVLLDEDRDGIAERRKIVISGSTLLSDDPWNMVDMAGGVTTAIPQRYKGLSLFDKLKDIQNSKTPILRSIIDGTQLSSNPRIGAVKGDANIDDLITSRTGGIVRSKTVNGVYAIPNAEVPPSSFQFLDLMDNLRRERGGSAIGMANEAQKIQGDTAHAFERTMSSMELSNALLARTFAESQIRAIYTLFHTVIRENYKGEMAASISGEWVKSIPSKWKKRTAVVINIGASNAERQRQKSAMIEVITFQGQLRERGSVMYDEAKEYSAIAKAVTLSGIKNPEAYYVDPNSNEGKQKSERMSQQAQEAKAKQQQLEQAMAKAQTDLGEAELGKAKAALISQSVKMENDKLKNELTNMKQLLDANAKSIDQELKDKEMDQNEALKLTELELEANRDLSKQNEDNKAK